MTRDYLVTHQSSLEHYTAEAFTLRCFDDRFWKIFKHFLKKQGVQHIDPESVAGGAKILASPEKESDRDFMLREIEKSMKLHGTKKVMLFTHHDCGVYGGIARFSGEEGTTAQRGGVSEGAQATEEAEFAFHTEEHRKAKEIIQARFPELIVDAYFIDAHGVVKTF